MDRTKLIKIFKLLLFVLLLILLFTIFILPKLKNNEPIIKPKEDEGISTDSTFQASAYNDNKLVQDYSNPTATERMEIDSMYGKDNNYFDEEGLHLINMADLVEGQEDRLLTDKWPENNELIKMVKKPDMQIEHVEVAETYLRIYVSNIKKKDLEKYIDDIKDEYKHELDSYDNKSLYRGYSDEHHLVEVKYYKDEKMGQIRYELNV